MCAATAEPHVVRDHCAHGRESRDQGTGYLELLVVQFCCLIVGVARSTDR